MDKRIYRSARHSSLAGGGIPFWNQTAKFGLNWIGLLISAKMFPFDDRIVNENV